MTAQVELPGLPKPPPGEEADGLRYRECMAEVAAVLKKYDMAGAITLVSKERCMFKYFFPTWSVITLTQDAIRFKAKRGEFPSLNAQRIAVELSAHIVMQMHDAGRNTVGLMGQLGKTLQDQLGMEHVGGKDFNPERDH